MSKYAAMIGLAAALALLAAATAQADEKDKEPAAIVEIGGAGDWSLRDGSASFGPNVAVEVTPIENWLEIEAGVSPLFGSGRSE